MNFLFWTLNAGPRAFMRQRAASALRLFLGAGMFLPLAFPVNADETPGPLTRPSSEHRNLRYDNPLPYSCLLDFSGTLVTKPAGFLRVGTDGHFHWGDGRRARFWGINISSTRLNIAPERIEQITSTLAHAGINLVRLEAIDNRNCLLGSVDAPDSRHFDPHYLDCIDHWIDALRRHGICYYLDLLDFRTFKSGDGVVNAEKMDRGARPYALFDPFLIQLQKEYAQALLTHRNPYSGLRLVDDPYLALVEICNESGFFLTPERLESLAEPYRTDLHHRWCHFLLDRYGTRACLAAAWGRTGNASTLRDEEDPARDTVDLPLLIGQSAYPQTDASRHARSRVRDGVEFLAGVQRAGFRDIRDYLRHIGLKVPVTAVVSNTVVADVASVAQECDFTAENWYGENQDGDARTPGLSYYSNRNPLRSDAQGGFAPYTAALHWLGKPVVVREWATTWPNRWRSSSVPEALAYAALQDYDAILLFGYQTNQAPNGAQAEILNNFSFQADPTTWGLYALAGRAFLDGAIRPAEHTVTLNYPGKRAFSWPNDLTPLARAAWSVRLDSTLSAPTGPFAAAPTGDASDEDMLQALLDRLGKRGAPLSSASIQNGVWRSDTGQITRYSRQGRIELQTPTLLAIAGEFTPGKVYTMGRLRFSTATPCGTLLIFATDGKPIFEAQHLIVKMVSRAENTGQKLERAPRGAVSAWVLRVTGRAPVCTCGRASRIPTRVWLDRSPPGHKQVPAQPLVTLYLVDGTWEMDIDHGNAAFVCDTPGIRGRALGLTFTTKADAGLMRLAEK